MEGHPVETSRFWYGLPPELDHIDAVYERVGDGSIVFFSGNLFTHPAAAASFCNEFED